MLVYMVLFSPTLMTNDLGKAAKFPLFPPVHNVSKILYKQLAMCKQCSNVQGIGSDVTTLVLRLVKTMLSLRA